jgi:hypothetical protein
MQLPLSNAGRPPLALSWRDADARAIEALFCPWRNALLREIRAGGGD